MNKEFISILEKSRAIHDKKNQDYTSGTNVDENFERIAEVTSWFNHSIDKSFASFIAVKLARLATLLNKTNSPNFESVDDTFVDLVTYAGLWGGNVCRRLGDIENNEPNWNKNTADLSHLKSNMKELMLTDQSSQISIKPYTEFKYIGDPVKVITPKEKKLHELINMYDSLTDDNYRELLSLARIMKSKNR